MNASNNETAAGLTTCLTKDGQSTPTGNIKLGNFKLINVGPGTASTDAATFGQLSTGSTRFITAAGTNTVTGTMNPTLLAYTTGDTFTFIVAAANTSTVTLNIDGLGAKDIRKNGVQPLIAGDLIIGSIAQVVYDGTVFQLLDPNVQTEFVWIDGGGTSDAITATYLPALTAVVDGLLLGVRATAANTTATPTFSPNSLTARTIVKNNGAALVAGDIAGDQHDLLLRYDLSNTRWNLLNPKSYTSPTTTQGDIIVRGASVDARLGVGSNKQAPISNGTTLVYGNVLQPDVTNTLTKGYNVTPNAIGTVTTGTTTPDPANGNFQTLTANGAFTLAVPGSDCTIIIQITNGASAGTITTSGYTKVSGAFTTTNGDDFFSYITKVGTFSFLNIVALQ